jgi:hypothetical protein
MVKLELYSINCLFNDVAFSFHTVQAPSELYNHVLLVTNCVGFEIGFVVKMLVFYIFAKSPVKLNNEHKHLQNCQC